MMSMTAKHSALLAELLRRAAGEEPKLAGNAIIAPHFWLALLRFVADHDILDTLPDLDTHESASELKSVREMLAGYLPSVDYLLDELCKGIVAEGDKSAIEVFVFKQMLDRAALEAKDETVTVPMLLKVLLRDPPPAIRNFKPTAPQTTPKAAPAPGTTASSIASLLAAQQGGGMPPLKPTTTDASSTTTATTTTTTSATAPAATPKERGKVAGLVSKVNEVRDALLEEVYGQDHAISAFTSGYFRAELTTLTNKNNKKPRATFLFAGPPGTGKTFLAEEIAKNLGMPYCRFDMSEYADKEANIEFCG